MSIPNSAGNSRTPSPEALAIARARLEAERGRVAALSLYARRMSHDMSNFITVVRTYSELLLGDLPATSATHQDVLEIHRAADAMIDYMQRIARFARASTARAGSVALDEVIAEVVREPLHAHRIKSDLVSNARVSIDAMWFVEALRELVANAREASSPESSISVKSWNEVVTQPMVTGGMPIDAGTWAVVEISDDGAGFSEATARQSLDPFVTAKSGVRGAGFGLALARGAVWQAGGQIVLTASDGANEDAITGGSVRLWLPVEPTA